jgi:hypothetical protein
VDTTCGPKTIYSSRLYSRFLMRSIGLTFNFFVNKSLILFHIYFLETDECVSIPCLHFQHIYYFCTHSGWCTVNSCFLPELGRYIRTYIVWKTPVDIRTILTIASNISGHTCTIIVIEQIRTCAVVQARNRYTFVSF